MFKIYGYTPDVYNCAPCINAKRLLDSRQYPYQFISVAKVKTESGKPILDNAVLDELQKLTNTRSMSMPQIFDGEYHIGGFDQLKEYLRK
ncbi:thioredoxin [Pectobacterium phage POP12]|nr:thioredoxin [Pectobacterium phage POP12]